MKATNGSWYTPDVWQFSVQLGTGRIIFFQVRKDTIYITEPETDSVSPLLHYDKPVIEYLAEYVGGDVGTYPSWMNQSLRELL